MLEGADPGFLREIFGFRVVADRSPRDPKNELVVSAHEKLEEIDLSSADARDHLFVGKRR